MSSTSHCQTRNGAPTGCHPVERPSTCGRRWRDGHDARHTRILPAGRPNSASIRPLFARTGAPGVGPDSRPRPGGDGPSDAAPHAVKRAV
ncbi:hypothetical protein KCH_20350 [Kitasatospora cheerisanensis KCTC 2395]|uniref:Uncharacterized protein n=1 Tax=Kitasatospora cheerisanensis KCTC 2395 TaxID=1348663 RepID=A0A066YXG9_9ACTN|nr:hypothetical protein KCH_20350 [Kitasatospora cheerisanensis KCTC 2395]